MLSRRSLLGSLAKNLLAAGVLAAPLAAFLAPPEVKAQETPAAPEAPKHVTVRRRRRRPFRRRSSDRPPLQSPKQ